MVTTTSTAWILHIHHLSPARLLLVLIGCSLMMTVKQMMNLSALLVATAATPTTTTTTTILGNESVWWRHSWPTTEQKRNDDDWWMEYADRIAQPFSPWNGTQWCQMDMRQSLRIQQPAHTTHRFQQPGSSSTTTTSGFMLTKVHKAASTTAASVTLRIAYRVAHRKTISSKATTTTTSSSISPFVTPMCHAHFYHEFAQENYHSHRNRQLSFLWGTVRLPHARSESAYYYYLPEDQEHGHDRIIPFLELSRGHQLRLLRRRKEELVLHQGNLYGADDSPNQPPLERSNHTSFVAGPYPEHVRTIESDPERLAVEYIQNQVLQHYDFIAVVERWVESMAVLKLLLPEVQYSDVIALRVKERGSYVSHLDDCKYNPPHRTMDSSPIVQSYLQGPFRQTNPDYLLYAAINRSLDLTIDRLGRERVEDGVRQIQYLQKRAEQECRDETILPCSEQGQRQTKATKNCYVRDFGCGHACLDRVLEEEFPQPE